MQRTQESGKLQVGDVVYFPELNKEVVISKVDSETEWWFTVDGELKKGKGSLKQIANKLASEEELGINRDKCIICEQRPIQSAYWMYVWKGKNGYACDSCGVEFHNIGYYLLDKAAEYLEASGIPVFQTKEKFGRMLIYTNGVSSKQEVIVQALQEFYQKRYPEFTWDFC